MRAMSILCVSLFLCASAVAVSELQEAKDTAFAIEGYLERLQVEADSAFSSGRFGKDVWEEYCAISGRARTFHHLMTMALLLYDEAPTAKYRGFVLESTLSVMHCLAVLDSFCDAVGIEIQLPVIYQTTAMS